MKIDGANNYRKVKLSVSECNFKEGNIENNIEAYDIICTPSSKGEIVFSTSNFETAKALITTKGTEIEAMILKSRNLVFLDTDNLKPLAGFIAGGVCRKKMVKKKDCGKVSDALYKEFISKIH